MKSKIPRRAIKESSLEIAWKSTLFCSIANASGIHIISIPKKMLFLPGLPGYEVIFINFGVVGTSGLWCAPWRLAIPTRQVSWWLVAYVYRRVLELLGSRNGGVKGCRWWWKVFFELLAVNFMYFRVPRTKRHIMGVSKNRDTPKWMVYNGNPY